MIPLPSELWQIILLRLSPSDLKNTLLSSKVFYNAFNSSERRALFDVEFCVQRKYCSFLHLHNLKAAMKYTFVHNVVLVRDFIFKHHSSELPIFYPRRITDIHTYAAIEADTEEAYKVVSETMTTCDLNLNWLLDTASREGSLNTLKFLTRYLENHHYEQILFTAVYHNQIKVLQWLETESNTFISIIVQLRNRNPFLFDNPQLEKFARKCNVEVLTWLFEQFEIPHGGLTKYLIYHIDKLISLLEKKVITELHFNSEVIENLFENERIYDILKADLDPSILEYFINVAAHSGNLAIIQWIMEHKTLHLSSSQAEDIMTRAISGGSPIVTYQTESVVVKANSKDSLSIVTYLWSLEEFRNTLLQKAPKVIFHCFYTVKLRKAELVNYLVEIFEPFYVKHLQAFADYLIENESYEHLRWLIAKYKLRIKVDDVEQFDIETVKVILECSDEVSIENILELYLKEDDADDEDIKEIFAARNSLLSVSKQEENNLELFRRIKEGYPVPKVMERFLGLMDKKMKRKVMKRYFASLSTSEMKNLVKKS